MKPQKPNIYHTKERPTPRTLPHNVNARSTQSKNNIIPEDDRLITTKEQILTRFPDVFEGIGKFLGKPYKIQLDPKLPPKQTPCRPIPIHLKDAFKQELDKMLKAGVQKPVQEATPLINSFVLIEGTDKQGKPKLHICLDPTNLNKAIIREPYHFKTPEDISHLLANSTVMTILDCKKGYWHQELDKASSYLTTFNTEFGRYRYTVMLFGTTIAGNVFQRKLDQCFGHLQNVIVIADDIMVIGKQPNHKDHDLALTTLLNTSRKCNVHLTMRNSNTNRKKSNSLEKHIQQMVVGQRKVRSRPYKTCQLHNEESRYSHLLAWLTTCQSSQLGYLSLQNQSEIYVKRKYPSIGDQNMMVHSS